MPFAVSAAATLQKTFQCFRMAHAPSPWGICTPSNTWFLGPTRVFIQNSISISSAVFEQLTIVSHYFTRGPLCFPPKLLLPLRISGPPSNTGYLGPPESSSQIASRSVHPFLYGFQMLCCIIYRQWGRKPPKLPLPLGILSPLMRTEPPR